MVIGRDYRMDADADLAHNIEPRFPGATVTPVFDEDTMDVAEWVIETRGME